MLFYFMMSKTTWLKQQIRQQAASARRKLTAEQRQAYSASIMQYAQDYVSSNGTQCLLTYKALPVEVNTDVLLEGNTWKAYAPRMLDEHHMVWIAVGATSVWKKSDFGVLEPIGDELWQPSSMKTTLLCPLLAFDRQGHRLGMGKGYFDRWLSKYGGNIDVVGLAYSCQELPKVPVEPHDVPLSTIITEHGVFACPTT